MQQIITIFAGMLFFCSLAYADEDPLFRIQGSGDATAVDVILCLDGKGLFSCQNYKLSAINSQITTTIAHSYPNAGIKINTSGFVPQNCIPHSNGYCLFSVSNTKPASINLNYTLPKTNQSITFTSSAPITVGTGTTYQVAAAASSGLAVSFSIASTSSSVCSINNNLVTFNQRGTCVINANQAGSYKYNPASQQQQQVTVKSSQTINFTSNPPPNPARGTYYDDVSATASSGLSVTISVDAQSSQVCYFINDDVFFNDIGTCVLNANQPGDGSYYSATQVQQIITIKDNQTITLNPPPPNPAVGDTYNVVASATSGLPVTVTVDAGSQQVCSINNNQVSFNAAGNCVLNANQSGNNNYYPAPQIQQSFSVNKVSQTISFTSTPPSHAVIGDTYTVVATATSGLPVTVTVDAGSQHVCSISNNQVSFVAVGNCVLNANQSGNNRYDPAPQIQQSFNFYMASQTINFTSTAPSYAVIGDTYAVMATATSNLPVTLSVTSSAICTLDSNNVVTFKALGTCVINAEQNGNSDYNAATPVQQSIAVNQFMQTISFPPILQQTYTGMTNRISATSSSGLPVTFSVTSPGSAICSINSNNVLSFNAPGTCTVLANQAGNGYYAAAPTVQQTVQVAALPTSTIVYSGNNPKLGGSSASISLYAIVTTPIGVADDGEVTFTGLSNNNSCENLPVSSGLATCTPIVYGGFTTISASYIDSAPTTLKTPSVSPPYLFYLFDTSGGDTFSNTPPSAPINVTATPGNAAVNLNWFVPNYLGGLRGICFTVSL